MKKTPYLTMLALVLLISLGVTSARASEERHYDAICVKSFGGQNIGTNPDGETVYECAVVMQKTNLTVPGLPTVVDTKEFVGRLTEPECVAFAEELANKNDGYCDNL